MNKLVATLLFLLAVTACAKDADWNRFGYDVIQARERVVNPPSPSESPEPAMSYPQYQRERERQKGIAATK